MFDLFTPAKMHHHLVPFTCFWTLAMFVLLFYMIGEFPMFFQLFNIRVRRQTGELQAAQGPPQSQRQAYRCLMPRLTEIC